MTTLQDVFVSPLDPTRLASVIGPERARRFEATVATARTALAGRVVLNVNSTATGGGVAELLETLLAYARGEGIDARWVVVGGDPGFFAITKRIHNHLYGSSGDGGALGAEERSHYEATLQRSTADLLALVKPGDVVILHDPQTAGLAKALHGSGAVVVWRCHVGIDTANAQSRHGWEFLRPYLEDVPAFVFSSERFAPDWLPRDRLTVIAPSIDPFAPKNQPLEADEVLNVLQAVGLLSGTGRPPSTFTRFDGSVGRIERPVDLVGSGPAPPPDAPLVVQVSRWDSMKDMAGVLSGFAQHLADMGDAHLVLAGPSTSGVADDPEADAVLAECRRAWRDLPDDARARIHLVCLAMDDGQENAIVTNALQRHATVVVQKSLAEGFGLTVTEAMWKGRPVVASAVGGITDQVVSGETGWLIDDPHDLDSFAEAVSHLVNHPEEADRMGIKGRERARELFLGDRHLDQWVAVLTHGLE